MEMKTVETTTMEMGSLRVIRKKKPEEDVLHTYGRESKKALVQVIENEQVDDGDSESLVLAVQRNFFEPDAVSMNLKNTGNLFYFRDFHAFRDFRAFRDFSGYAGCKIR